MHAGPLLSLFAWQVSFIYVVVVIANKKQVIEHAKYRRLERIKVGKRQVVFLERQLSALGMIQILAGTSSYIALWKSSGWWLFDA